ncbi:hypothetical protein EGR_00448 [Echinococcus granulosus]|uniref:Uncharacterized protein n=1 Tax=Echinococcus granulosus TaxID=6210 RepID=W6UT99_ECHGR|nr:hypothetical protein EGR_00448 [Echinococcus granulosus]EUB64498.1 hypothetical protein EGR_00448 [Echinococcus granulosus]
MTITTPEEAMNKKTLIGAEKTLDTLEGQGTHFTEDAVSSGFEVAPNCRKFDKDPSANERYFPCFNQLFKMNKRTLSWNIVLMQKKQTTIFFISLSFLSNFCANTTCLFCHQKERKSEPMANGKDDKGVKVEEKKEGSGEASTSEKKEAEPAAVKGNKSFSLFQKKLKCEDCENEVKGCALLTVCLLN